MIAAPATNIPQSRVMFEISPVFGMDGSLSAGKGVGVMGDTGSGLDKGIGFGVSPGVSEGLISVSG